MKTGDDDYLSDIEQYYGFDLKSTKSSICKHQATWKKLIIRIGFFLTMVTMRIILVEVPTLVKYISLKSDSRS